MMKLFDLFETEGVIVTDPGLKGYINLDPRLIIKNHGRAREKFTRMKVSIVEKLINELAVPGHRGKKHKIITRVAGKHTRETNVIIKTLKIIQKQTNQNPLQILVKAIENSSPRDEVTAIEYGGAKYPQAVDISPTRRLSLALRNIVHGAYDKSFNKKKKIYEVLADELIKASENSSDCFSITKKNEMEKQADSAR